MTNKRIRLPHWFSLLNYSDLEILYTQLRKHGLDLQSVNSWSDCFTIKKGKDTRYKIIPSNIPLEKINMKHWKLKVSHTRYNIFEYSVDESDLTQSIYPVNKKIIYNSDFLFLPAFALWTYSFINQYYIRAQAALPTWIHILFVLSLCFIFTGHCIALLTFIFERLFYKDDRRLTQKTKAGFLLRLAFSAIVNLFQFILILLGLWMIF